MTEIKLSTIIFKENPNDFNKKVLFLKNQHFKNDNNLVKLDKILVNN